MPDIEGEIALDFRTAPDAPYTRICAHAKIVGLSRYRGHVRGYPILGWPPPPGRSEYSTVPLAIRARTGTIGGLSRPSANPTFLAIFRMRARVCTPGTTHGNVALACASFSSREVSEDSVVHLYCVTFPEAGGRPETAGTLPSRPSNKG